jgi:predicted nucleic acid-binding protein
MYFEEFPPDWEVDRNALVWAERIGQRAAYDAVYLALAEYLNAELWTADKRLADAAQVAGVEGVFSLPTVLR